MASTKYKFDVSHSHIGFSIRHMMFAKVRGQFAAWQGELVLDAERPSDSYVTASIDAASIDTGVADRDAHLRSADFFDVETFPTIEFASKSFERSEGGYLVAGDLTMHGVTKPVVLAVEHNGGGIDPWGQRRIGLSVSVTLKRKDFGLNWNQALEAGGVLVGEDVVIDIELQAIALQATSESAA